MGTFAIIIILLVILFFLRGSIQNDAEKQDGTSVLNAGARWKWEQRLDIVVLIVAIIKGTAIFKSYKWFANSNS